MIEVRYRTIWRRFCAGVVDALILSPVTLGSVWIWKHHANLPPAVLVGVYLCSSLAGFAYSIFFLGRYGKTIGKMALHVTVMDIGERVHIDYVQALKRNIVPLGITILLILPGHLYLILTGNAALMQTGQSFTPYNLILSFINLGWFLAEIFSVLVTAKRRAIHDFIAGSVIVRD